jgi:hypothetical protein
MSASAPNRRRHVGCLGLLAFVVLAGLGCGGQLVGGDPGSRTGGWAVELLRRTDDGAAAWYRAQGDGTLEFAGAIAALERTPTWTGALTDEEIAQLVDLLQRSGWLQQAPPDGEPRSLKRQFTIVGPQGRKRFTLRGADADADAIESVLDHAARRRNEPALQSLPHPQRP